MLETFRTLSVQKSTQMLIECTRNALHTGTLCISIQTRWRRVFGPTRYYAFVFTADGNDLAELLVRNGLARIYGTRTPLSDGRDSRTYLAALRDFEQQAKSAGSGRTFLSFFLARFLSQLEQAGISLGFIFFLWIHFNVP